MRIRPSDVEFPDDPLSESVGGSTFRLDERIRIGPRQRASIAAYVIPYFRDFPDWRAEPLTYGAAKSLVSRHPNVDPQKVRSLNVKRNVERVAEKIEELGFDLRGDDRGRKFASLIIGRRLVTDDDYEEIPGGLLHIRLPDALRRP